MKLVRDVLSMVTMFVVLSATTQAENAEALANRIDALVNAKMKDNFAPGLALGVIRGGKPVLAKGYGFANVEHDVPVTVQTIFQSGSVGKQFTSALLMTLVEEGKLGVDDPIRKHLPEAPPSWSRITIRHLLSHTSGIPEYTTPEFDYRRDYTDEDLLKFCVALTPEFPPGSRFQYSNTGYVLLGLIIGKVSGRFYGDLLRERIFERLGMQTARVISEEDIVRHRAGGYVLVDGQLKNQQWVAPRLNTTADGSLYLSLTDFIAWDAGVRRKAILKPESWRTILTPHQLTSGRSYPYGFGWFIEEEANERRVELHPGHWQGFVAQISRYVSDDFSILALANSATADVTGLINEIAAMIDPVYVPPELKPIRDREPKVRARAQALLEDARSGGIGLDQFAHAPAERVEQLAAEHQQTLKGLGPMHSIALVKRRELGDDRIYSYELKFAERPYLLRLCLTPQDKICSFDLYPKD
jgi:CubicO group peptidase (beta-lactamase class C family)